MNESYQTVYRAALDALEQLERRNYNSNPVIYIHPETWSEAESGICKPVQDETMAQRFIGCDVMCNPNLPKNVVMAVDVGNAVLSSGSVAFGTVTE